MSAYAYPPPTSGQSAEPYRASPTGSHVSLPSLNLPPIRNLDGRSPTLQHQTQVAPPSSQQHQQQLQQHQQQQQQQQHPQHQQQQHQAQPTSGQNAMGSPLAPPMGQYYPNPPQSLGPPPQQMNLGADPNQPLRYPLPATDNRMMSGGRHKKEIKRRTKTGCLTCRKRRIKCDEAHPTCRNCVKSKRECLGYDPIFKSQPGPAPIQPAPSAAPSMQPHLATSSPYPPPPQGYMPAGSQPYPPSLTAGATSPDSSEPYDYAAAIDPALEGPSTTHMQVNPLYDGTHEAKLGAKPTKIEDLLDVGGVPPPDIKASAPLPPSALDAVKSLYTSAYAAALDRFFETRWFTTRAISHIVNDTLLCEMYATLLQRMSLPMTMPQSFRENAITQSLEAHVLWSTMLLCRQVSAIANSTTGANNYIEVNEGVHDAAKRLHIFETLITNQYLDSEPLPEINTTGARNGHMLDDQLKQREREFWRLISRFLTLHDDEAASANEIDDTLASIRHFLDSRENRDVIYSIAISRHIGQRMAEGGKGLENVGEVTNDENDPRAKLQVARTFVQTESGGKGTTQVVQRICGMAIRSWGAR